MLRLEPTAKGIQASPLFSKKMVSYVQFLMWIQIHTLGWARLEAYSQGGVYGCDRLTFHLTSALLFPSLDLFSPLVDGVITKTPPHNYFMDSMKTTLEVTLSMLYV